MAKALTQPLWTWLHIWAWIQTLRSATGWEWAVPYVVEPSSLVCADTT